MKRLAGWCSGNDIAGGLGFDFLADQIEHSVDNDSPPLHVSSVLPRRKAAEMNHANLLHASTYYGEFNEDLIFLIL